MNGIDTTALADFAAAVTADPKRGIRQYYWAFDGKHLLYLQDTGGDENFHLYATNLESKQTRDLTPFPGVRVQGVDLDKHFPNEVLAALNKRNKAVFDMHRNKLDSGEEALDTENPGMALGFAADMRDHQLLKAEEMAQKVSAKLSMVLVGCFLPALITAVIAPIIFGIIATWKGVHI